MKYVKQEFVDAQQLTEEAVWSNLLDRDPLPRGLYLGAASYHAVNRVLYDVSIFVSGGLVRCHINDWIIEDSEGMFSVCGPIEFAKKFKPA
jgi:hypothetical protein